MPKELFDDDTMGCAIDAWKRAINALHEITQSVCDIVKCLYDAFVKAQRIRRENRTRWRRPNARDFAPVTYLYIRPHAAYVRFHVAATGD